MELLTALGACPKCRQYKISVNGESRCINCDSNNNTGSGLVVDIEDPGEEGIKKVLANSGVAVGQGGKPPTPAPREANKQVIAPKVETKATGSVEMALEILRSLPMPKDLKQFKQINKAIKILESLGE
jgi:hypothetical protein